MNTHSGNGSSHATQRPAERGRIDNAKRRRGHALYLPACFTRRWTMALPAAVALMALLLFAGSAPARSYGDIHISPIAPTDVPTHHGYLAWRVRVVNSSPSQSHIVRLSLRGTTSGSSIRAVQRTVQVPPGGRARVSLMQPPLKAQFNGIRVTIDGQTQEDPTWVKAPSHGKRESSFGSSPDITLRVLSCQELAEPSFDVLTERLKKIVIRGSGSSSGSSKEPSITRAAWPADNWPGQWLALSRWDALVLTEDAWRMMPPEARQAVWDYTRAGGQLLVEGEIELPSGWKNRDLAAGEPYDRFALGFGQCILTGGTPKLADWSNAQLDRVINRWRSAMAPWEPNRDFTDANNDFPVVEDVSVPVRALLGLVTVFALVMGPLNFVVLSRLNRRIWLLWTVPVLAVLFSGAVFGAAVWSEGWNPRVRSSGITVLDQRNNRASTIGWLGYYCPMTPGDALTFDRATELTPEVVSSYRYTSAREGQPRTIDWTQGQRLTSGWLQARVPAHFLVRKTEPRRERVTVRKQDNQLVAVNGLGTRIDKLTVADRSGSLYRATDIEPGDSVTLKPLDEQTENTTSESLSGLYNHENWLNGVEDVKSSPREYLKPGCYIAVTDQPAAFIESGLDSVRDHRAEWVVVGIMGQQSNGN